MKKILLSIGLASTAALAMAQTPVVSFNMEPDGNTFTESVSGKTFQMHEHTFSTDDASLVQTITSYAAKGARGKCVRYDGFSTFPGAEGNVNGAQIDASKLSNQDITFSIWVAPQTWPLMNVDVDSEDWMTLCGNLDDGKQTGCAFFLSNRGHYSFEAWTSVGKIKASAGDNTLPCYEWSHLVGIIHGSAADAESRTVALYRNGSLLATGKLNTTDWNTGSDNFLIGKSADDIKTDVFWLNSFCGLFDDVKIYNGVQMNVVSDNTPENAVDMQYDIDKKYNNKYGRLLRPRFHGMPDGGWTNEPHGLTYYNGRWHVFFQKNASDCGIMNQKWGHISSSDLCTWREEKIAIQPDSWYDKKGCWSGCLVHDDAFNGGKPTIMYTGVDFARAMISMASPLDDNLTNWSKASFGNPVIDGVPSGYSADYHDCYFFNNNGQRYAIVGCAKDGIGCAILFKYENGAFVHKGEFFKGSSANVCGNFWEMPNITPMGNGKWLFTCTPLGMDKGVKCIYWIGTINDDGTFNPTSPSTNTTYQQLEMTGSSLDGYGLLSPSIYNTSDGKTLLMGVVPDKVGGDFNYRWGWAHNYSLPREISLSDDGTTLIQKPYSGLEKLRVQSSAFSGENVAVDETGTKLGDVQGRYLELYAEITLSSTNKDAETGFRFLKNTREDGTESYAKVYYKSGTVNIDLNSLDRVCNDWDTYKSLYTGVVSERAAKGTVIKLHMYLDASNIDIFVNDKYAFSQRCLPNLEEGIGVEAYSTVSTTMTTLKAWKLSADGSETGIEELITDKKEEMTADSRIFDLSGRQLSSIPSKGMYIQNGKKYIVK